MENKTNIMQARRIAPARKVPVISTRAPMISGPPNPPISAIQKNRPPAEPMYLDPTSVLSINTSIRSGKNEEAVMPNITNPANTEIPDVVTIARIAAAAISANTAMIRSLKLDCTI